MLRELHISNLAVIADVRIELRAGAELLHRRDRRGQEPGHRRDRGAARPAQPGGDAPARRRTRGASAACSRCATPELLKRDRARSPTSPVTADGGELLLTRRLYASGRSSVSLNGNPITLGDAQAGRRAPRRRARAARPPVPAQAVEPARRARPVRRPLATLRRRYHDVYEQRQSTRRQRLAELSANRTLREQQLELYRFQADEIDTAELDAGEYEELAARASVLQNLEKLKKDARRTHARAVRGRRLGPRAAEDDGGGARRAVRRSTHNLKPDRRRHARRDDRAGGGRVRPVALPRQARPRPRPSWPRSNDRLNTINRVLNKYGDPVDADARLPRGDRREDRRAGTRDATTSSIAASADRAAAARS